MHKEGGTYVIRNGARVRVSPIEREKLLTKSAPEGPVEATAENSLADPRNSISKKTSRGN